MIPPTQRTFYDLQPILPLNEWWQMSLFVLTVFLLVSFVVWMYRSDAIELPRGTAFLLTVLRILVLLFVLIFVLNPQLRSETRFNKSSKLAILVDTSLSMGLKDEARVSVDADSRPRRMDAVVSSLSSQPTISALRRDHDITFYRFSEAAQPDEITTFNKTTDTADQVASPQDPTIQHRQQMQRSRNIGFVAICLFVLAVAFAISWLITWSNGEQKERAAWLSATSVLVIIAGVALLSLADLNTPEADLAQSLGWKNPDVPADLPLSQTSESSMMPVTDSTSFDWKASLTPKGTSTRLGNAIQNIVNKERGGPIAGIVVITDGRSNTGTEPSRAIASAANAGIPIFPVGIGSTETPKNVQVADIQAPPRVFPGDKFQIKGLVQAFGLEGKTIRVDLISVDEKETEAEMLEDETTVRLAADGQSTPVEFEVTREEQGKRRYVIRTAQVEGDFDPRDDQRGATVEIVDRLTKVLLIAGGPTREFRFLRNQLFRDKDVDLHVWLQTAKKGADQEADEMLFEFPQSRERMFSYDCIIAFDPDWRDLDAGQAALLERWVAEKAGGLVAVAGPVHMPEWTRRPRGDETIDKIRRLYPVSFYSQGSAILKLGRFGGIKAFPLEFTREGRAAEYLWLGDSSADSQSIWAQFDGVFGYYAVNEAKPGADILANFADPNTLIDDRLPIYLASHFYGAGRVFFQASGEMWRVRRLDVEYFQNYYLKLLRWVSQGRLLRDSTRGVLLTDRERCWMGDQIVVQAILRDNQDAPLMRPRVDSVILRPDGSTETLELRSNKDSVRPGTFTGQFSANLEGEYRISLPIPDSPDFETLTTQIQSNIPDLEKERPQRNDELLSEIADKTQGHYYVGMSAFDIEIENPLSPTQLIQPQDQETLLPGTPDRNFQRRLMMWLLILIVLCLAQEWTFRRLHKLA